MRCGGPSSVVAVSTTASRLVLGTAAFGLDYGVTNAHGRVSDAELEAILELASALGVQRLDTALEYGDAQDRLRPWADRFSVTTKVRAGGDLGLGAAVGQCLEQLGLTVLDEVLIHDWFALDAAQRATAAAELTALQEEGIVDAIGISAYEAAELEAALAAFESLDAVQVPVNALDQRLEDSDALAALLDAGVKVEARSVLLQGLLAAPAQHPAIAAFQSSCDIAGVTWVAGAVGFVQHLPWVDELVLGVTSAAELRELAQACDAVPVTWPVVASSFASQDLALIDPRQWNS